MSSCATSILLPKLPEQSTCVLSITIDKTGTEQQCKPYSKTFASNVCTVIDICFRTTNTFNKATHKTTSGTAVPLKFLKGYIVARRLVKRTCITNLYFFFVSTSGYRFVFTTLTWTILFWLDAPSMVETTTGEEKLCRYDLEHTPYKYTHSQNSYQPCKLAEYLTNLELHDTRHILQDILFNESSGCATTCLLRVVLHLDSTHHMQISYQLPIYI